jgi:hypothetical protein
MAATYIPKRANPITAIGSIGLDSGLDSRDCPMKINRRNPAMINPSMRADHLITTIAAFFLSWSVFIEPSF